MSPNTIISYRDAFKLFLIFCSQHEGLAPEKLTFTMVTKERIISFLDWLENSRGCSAATRNQRLSAICGFIRYVQQEVPDHLFEWQRIQGIPSKKTAQPLVPYLTEDALSLLFQQLDTTTAQGRRDLVLLAVMYDSAARVQELADLRVCDVRLTSPAIVTLLGKGQKTRQVPLLVRTKELLTGYVAQHQKLARGIPGREAPLFFNQRREKLSRWGIAHILQKYVVMAQSQDTCPSNVRVTPMCFATLRPWVC